MDRDTLIELCKRGVVPVKAWSNRDSAEAQLQLSKARTLLESGCVFVVSKEIESTELTMWVRINWPGFASFDYDGPEESELFYIPTASRLDAANGGDWY